MIRHVIKANSILLIQYAVGSLVPLLLIPHIVGVIGLAEYGHLAVLMAWGGYGATIVQYSFHLTGPKRVMQLKSGDTIAAVFIDVTTTKISLLCFAILVIVSLNFLLSNESKSSYAWLILIAMPLAAGLNSIWLLQSQDKFIPICALSTIGSIITLLIGFHFIRQGSEKSVDVAVLVSIFGNVFIGLCTFFYAVVLVNIPTYKIQVANIINSLTDGWHLFVSQFISMIYSASGPVVINYFLNSEAAGAYSVTERVMSALMAGALLTHTAAYPRLAATYISDRDSYWRTIKLILIGYLAVTLVASMAIWSARGFVLNFLYGGAGNDHSSLLFFGLLWFITGIFGTTLTGYLTVSGQTSAVWPLTLKILFVSLVLGILGIKILGDYGWLAALVAAQSIVFYTGYRYWNLSYEK